MCLLVVAAALTVLGSWFARRLVRATAQRELVEQIRVIGGKVYYEYQCDESSDWPLNEEEMPKPGWLEDLLGEDFLHDAFYVSFIRFERSNGGLLAIDKHHASDAELLRLKELPRLRWLALDGRQLTEAGLEHLREFTGLERLWMADVRVSGTWAEHLAGMANLKQIYLPFTPLSDAGVKQLESLSGHETLD